MKKKLLFLLPLFLFIISPKDTFALSITAYDDNYKVVGSCQNCTELYPDNGVDYVKSIYITYDDAPITNGVKYKLETTFNLFARGTVGYITPILYSNGVNQNITQDYYYVNSSTTVPFPDSGENGKRLNIGYIGYFTSTQNGTSLLEIPFSNRVVFSGIQVTSRSFTYNGDSTVDAVGSASNNIITNNNNNTNKIIDNSDKNSNKLKESIDKQTEATKEQTETIKDKDTTESQNKASGFFNDFENDDYGLSDIITMPLTFIKGLSNSTCSSLNLPLPFVDKNATLPCMTSIYQTHFGSFLTIYQTITTGIIAYWCCINIFRLVQGFKDPDSDEIEVMDL